MVELESLLVSLASLGETSLVWLFRREALKWSFLEEVS
jgi:hypothetical protein